MRLGCLVCFIHQKEGRGSPDKIPEEGVLWNMGDPGWSPKMSVSFISQSPATPEGNLPSVVKALSIYL